jgi:hypothetical protein
VLVDKVSSFAPVQAQGTPPADYKAAGDGYYRGADAQSPVVGDVRVTFAGVPAQTVSVVGALAGNTVTAYRDDTGYTIALAEPGVVSATGLFTDAQKAEGRLTWILRGAGFAGVLFGFLFIAGPVTILFAVLPFLKSLADAGAFLVALTFAVPLTLVTIGFAWLAHRPVLGGGLLAAAFAAFVLLRLMHPRRTAAA